MVNIVQYQSNGMAKTIRSPQTATQNWTQRTSGAANFYQSQVQASAWKVYAASAQAEANYAAGVQQAVAQKTRQNAVNQSSDETWKAGVNAVGVQRFSQGVQASAPKMAAVMEKLIPAISDAVKALPPRSIAGSQQNIQRMTTFVQALHAKRGQFKARGVSRSGG